MQGVSSGPEPLYLNVTEETELIQFLTMCATQVWDLPGTKADF